MILDIVGLQISVPEFILTIISFFLFMFLLNKFLFQARSQLYGRAQGTH